MKTLRSSSFLLAGILSLVPQLSAAPSMDFVTEDTTAQIGAKIHRTVEVIYPVPLLREGVSSGEARVLVNVDETGKITDTLPLAYTHERFLQATLDAIHKWKYEPAVMNGEPVGVVFQIAVRFEVSGILVYERVGAPNMRQEAFGEDYVYKVHGVRSLDSIPTPLHVVPPIYPQEWIDQGLRGSVTVHFYVDETGSVRLPAVNQNDHPLLAASAANAVREWRFSPPLYRGRPVLVHCQQVFNFAPK